MKELVILESPYAGNIETNTIYARRCVADSLKRDEAPIASHLLYTQEGILDDNEPDERQLGIDAGLSWLSVATKTVVYADYGISDGMLKGMKEANKQGITIEIRFIENNPDKKESIFKEIYVAGEPVIRNHNNPLYWGVTRRT